MTGGVGRDQFWINESVIPGTPHVITDFQLGTDSIVTSGSSINTAIPQGADILFQTSSGQTVAIVKNVDLGQFSANSNNWLISA
jgi:hypothetical protein